MDDRAVASEPRTRRHPDDVRRVFETGLRELGPEPDAQDVLAWAADAFGHRLAVASSMSDTVVAHLASQFVPDVHVVFLDTGLHFAETLAYRDRLHRELPITVVSARPALTVEQQAEQYGAELHRTGPRILLPDAQGRRHGRRAARPTRPGSPGCAASTPRPGATPPCSSGTRRRAMVKLNPIAAWSDDDVEAYVERHALPEHPLRPAGFLSIGCAPCTRAVAPGESPRAGRWADMDKTECGLHDDPVARTPAELTDPQRR